MQLGAVSLDDKYESREGRDHITGSQAIVRLAMMQRIRDRAAGLDTACYITGYRGSPMHNIDKELWSAKRFLPGSGIHFQPAINEDLAATAIWGTQQVTAFGDCRHDGIFSMWYGKGPGLDRSMDAIRHGHMAGSSRHGGVLVMVCEGCGDCNAKSNCLSVLPLDTEYGRKRRIDQSACNKDFSCVEGFCPSFVTVEGAKPRRGGALIEVPAGLAALPEPDRPHLGDGRPFSILMAGVGGTGVVTIGALVTMAAHLDGARPCEEAAVHPSSEQWTTALDGMNAME